MRRPVEDGAFFVSGISVYGQLGLIFSDEAGVLPAVPAPGVPAGQSAEVPAAEVPDVPSLEPEVVLWVVVGSVAMELLLFIGSIAAGGC